MDALSLLESHLNTLPDTGERFAKTAYSVHAVRNMVRFARALEAFLAAHPHPTRAQARAFIGQFSVQSPISMYRFTDAAPAYHTLAGKLMYGDFHAFQSWYAQEYSNICYTTAESEQYHLSVMQRTYAAAVSRLNYLGDY